MTTSLSSPLTKVEVNKSNLIHNLNQFKTLLPNLTIIPVIKSNAYGAGFSQIAEILKNETKVLSVVSTSEALKLRHLLPNHRIIVLSIIENELIETAIANNIELPLYNNHYFNRIKNSAILLDTQANIHLKIDLGTHRIGYNPKTLEKTISAIEKSKSLNLKGIFSHFAASEEDPGFTKTQKELFQNVITKLKKDNLLLHMACSAASLIGQNPKGANAIRLGISLYGYWPSDLTHTQSPSNIVLKPTITWKTKIIHIQRLPAGENIGYGLSYKTIKPALIATIPVGYYDGLDRKLSNTGHALVKGEKCKISGRICMNLTMLDISAAKKAKVGDEVILIGRQKEKVITPEEIANQQGTINYEVISGINPLIPRIVVEK